MADFMFWQIVIGAAVLVGLGITIYYARQIARAVNLSRKVSLTDNPTGVQAHPVQTQRAEGAHISQRGKVKL